MPAEQNFCSKENFSFENGCNIDISFIVNAHAETQLSKLYLPTTKTPHMTQGRAKILCHYFPPCGFLLIRHLHIEAGVLGMAY